MMKYCTIEDISKSINISEMVRSLDDENRNIEVDLTDEEDLARIRLEAIIESSSVEIDGYLRGHYTLPFSEIPSRIKDICVNITIYNVFRRRVLEVPDAILNLYKKCIEELSKIQKGEIIVESGQTVSSSQAFGAISNKKEADKLFNDSRLARF